TTAGAYGKVVAAHQEGQTIPADWAVDATGEGTIDPGVVLDGGALLPFGGHKGSGVAVLIEGLSAALSSAAFAFRTVDIWQDPSSQMNTGHLLLALDIAAFGDPDQVRRKVEELQQEVRASHPAAEVTAPGDLESSRLRAAARGLELAPATLAQLRELAAVRGAQFPPPLEEGTSWCPQRPRSIPRGRSTRPAPGVVARAPCWPPPSPSWLWRAAD